MKINEERIDAEGKEMENELFPDKKRKYVILNFIEKRRNKAYDEAEKINKVIDVFSDTASLYAASLSGYQRALFDVKEFCESEALSIETVNKENYNKAITAIENLMDKNPDSVSLEIFELKHLVNLVTEYEKDLDINNEKRISSLK